MKLLEYQGKELLKNCGIRIPPSIVTNNKSYINLSYYKEKYKEFFFDYKQVVIKAQIPTTGRKKNGFVVEAQDYETSLKLIDDLYKKEYNNTPPTTLLIEKKLDIANEYFLAIIYDTKTRKQTVLFSATGGIDVEELIQQNVIIQQSVSAITGLQDYQARDLAKKSGFTGIKLLQIATFIKKAHECFKRYDCRSCEINPIIETPDGLLYAGDAKITIDDNALARQPSVTSLIDENTEIGFLTKLEQEARKIDYNDYRGVAGKSFIELDGDIAVLASGGGASLTFMDALIEAGGKPANYVEYSGNPPKEKVRKLTQLTLSRQNIHGCIIVGSIANFTDIYETISGFLEGLSDITPKPSYPIVIRRAGPNDDKAFALINEFAQKHHFDITLFDENTPLDKAAEFIVNKTNEFKMRTT